MFVAGLSLKKKKSTQSIIFLIDNVVLMTHSQHMRSIIFFTPEESTQSNPWQQIKYHNHSKRH